MLLLMLQLSKCSIKTYPGDKRFNAVFVLTWRSCVSSSPSEQSGASSSTTRSRNFLLEPGSGSSESDSESDTEEISSSQLSPKASVPKAAGPPDLPALPSNIPKKLPPPLLNTHSDSSVFSNPFKAQADQNLSALQKHVPLTMQPRPSQIGGKRICVLYRKDGKCRFGIKCKFAHDSDLQTPVPGTHTHVPLCEDTDEIVTDKGSQNLQQETREEDTGGPLKKRRVGLSNSLIPPKRAMKQYILQRSKEQVKMP